jgi:hypothetical protein
VKKILSYEKTHKTINGILYKLCNTCEQWFPCTDEHFYKNSSSRDGLSPYCREYSIQKTMKWEKNNPDRTKELRKKVAANPKRKEYVKKANINWRNLGGQIRWQHNNMDKCVEYNRKWSKNKRHSISEEEIQTLYEYCDSSCMYCGMSEDEAKKQYGKKLFRDHFDNEGSNGIDNCILCCHRCSSSKGAKKFEEWYTKENSIYNNERYKKIIDWIYKFND